MRELSGIAIGRRTDADLDRSVAEAEGRELSYPHPGSTLVPGRVAGSADRTVVREVRGTLPAARAVLRRFAPHRGIAGRVHPPHVELEAGATLVVVAPFGPVEMCVPNRVVAVIDEPDRFGFAYGTLQGHAEAGEELFLAEVVGPDRLRLTIRMQARPATWPARLAGPVLTVLQRAALRRYVDAWTDAICWEPT